MRMEFFEPFKKIIGAEIHLELKKPLTLKELIHLLTLKYPAFGQDFEKNSDAELSAHVMFIKNGRPLKLSDSVADIDVVQVLLPISGG